MTKTVTPEQVAAARAAMDAAARDRDAAAQHFAQMKQLWQRARDEWVRLAAVMDGTHACEKCGGAGWLWWHELDEYHGPTSETCGGDDTKYPCDGELHRKS